jgi:hypothetical protein
MLFTDYQTTEQLTWSNIWLTCHPCWSYRFSLILALPEAKQQEYCEHEAKKVLKVAYKDPQNECAWNYLTGLMDSHLITPQEKLRVAEEVHRICTNIK